MSAVSPPNHREAFAFCMMRRCHVVAFLVAVMTVGTIIFELLVDWGLLSGLNSPSSMTLHSNQVFPRFKCNTPFTVLTHNVLETSDTFSGAWGCPVEIQRRDNLMKATGVSQQQAEDFLSRSRYERLAKFLDSLKSTFDAMTLQEAVPLCRASLEKYFNEDSNWRLVCTDASGEVMIWVNRNKVTKVHSSIAFSSPTSGCMAKLQVLGSLETVTLAAVGMSSSAIRNPKTVRETLSILLNNVKAPDKVSPIIIGADFNSHLPDLLPMVQSLDNSSELFWSAHTASNSTGLGFTTQHEHNWVGAYDGFLTRGLSHKAHTAVLEVGFMPKYMGGEYGPTPFQYGDKAFPNIDGELEVGHRLVPHSAASESHSDHFAVRSKLCLVTDSVVSIEYNPIPGHVH